MAFNKFFKDIILKLLTGVSETDYATMASQLTLEDAIAKIDSLFGCDLVLKEFNSDFTIPYYTQSEAGYQIYHSGDAMHMALNPDGVFHPDGYYGQPRVVAEQIRQIDAKNVLELGCGKGFNSLFLAEQYPEVNFTGIDLTPLHIKIAGRKANKLSNLSFEEGNFNQLNFADQSFDIVFGFECLCHAPQAQIPLAEIFRVLRPGGQLIVFDGYRKIELEQFSKLLQTASQLVEVSMAVRHGFSEIDDWQKIAQSIGFRFQALEDISSAIKPCLSRLQKLSLQIFSLPWKLKILTYLLPKYLVRNAIAGLLLPLTEDALGYYKIILERPLET
ncbi:class I SAM-dependent methyltransferase [Nodularia sp. UHCC 0506]|uniref:class I SAM-dependent methyltransferase n=1 Tax=Nodularia sp. UHCC 0506 TaxID=3110243 RepID=UPI002B1F3D77|nr:class I SAM-dependent methyltransferase [Nodularia sp. UHCC 0506]MEA5515113.1 class I SAM-dependent methyltransferase [Nodularia sp. UHCC 0506]